MKDTGLTSTLPVTRVREDYLQNFRELQESPRPHELEQVGETLCSGAERARHGDMPDFVG